MNTLDKDIIDNAVAAGYLATLSNAFRAAGLVGTLKGAGPFTLFAPTDEAFRKLPAGTVDGLLKDKVKLASILNYHVLPGTVLAKDLKDGDAKTVQGGSVTIASNDAGFTIDGAKVTRKDIESSNGVIHAIDTVMMPKQ